jgi:hypothetical protein
MVFTVTFSQLVICEISATLERDSPPSRAISAFVLGRCIAVGPVLARSLHVAGESLFSCSRSVMCAFKKHLKLTVFVQENEHLRFGNEITV